MLQFVMQDSNKTIQCQNVNGLFVNRIVYKTKKEASE